MKLLVDCWRVLLYQESRSLYHSATLEVHGTMPRNTSKQELITLKLIQATYSQRELRSTVLLLLETLLVTHSRILQDHPSTFSSSSLPLLLLFSAISSKIQVELFL